jgi:endonuclease/exonuclease/phosphatase (EEP) superfamily protein YafD
LTDKTSASGASATPSVQPVKRWWQFAKDRRSECMMGLLIGLLGLFAGRLGHIWVAFDVFAQFTVQFAFLTGAYLLGMLMPRFRLLTANVALVVALVAYGTWAHLAPQFEQAAVAPEGSTTVKLVSFNTWYWNEEVEAVRVEIDRLGADVVGLMEFGANKKPALASWRAAYPHQATCFNVDFCNLVILSKFPIEDFGVKIGWEGPPLMWARLGGDLDGLTLVVTHTIRFPHSRAQFRQIRGMVKFLETMPGRKIVMGDFNATPFSRITQTLSQQTGLVRLTKLPSWPSWLLIPQIAIDHVFVSPEIKLLEGQAIGVPSGSDHFPVSLTVAVP